MCIGRSSVEVVASDQRTDMDGKSSSRRRRVIPQLNIYHNLSRWVRRRHYQRLSKAPARSHRIRLRIHAAATRRRAAQIVSPRLQMVPGIHIRIISPISLLLRLRDAYSRNVSLIVTTTTTTTTSSAPKMTMTTTTMEQQPKQQQRRDAGEVIGEIRGQPQSVRELLAIERLRWAVP